MLYTEAIVGVVGLVLFLGVLGLFTIVPGTEEH